ncbi:MAG: hypothetical protein HY784_06170 [Chloroflexi bacterium]|nr:hypothetical protein [Chloroflexota bacterium]
MTNRKLTRTQWVFLAGWGAVTLCVGLGTFAAILWATGAFDSLRAAGTTTPTETTTPATAPGQLPPPTLMPTTVAATQPEADTCGYPPLPASGFLYGIQMNPFISDNSYFMGIANNLKMSWIKAQIRWADLELTRGDFNWGALDNVLNTACEKKLRVLLSIVTAPAWTQAKPPAGVAPPDDHQLYAGMVASIIRRYPGQVGAVEVWNEQNLEREWDTPEGISPEAYLRLLQATYAAVKDADPNVMVISGALSPTGINCTSSFPQCAPGPRVVVMDDARYLSQFVALGGLNYADCVGTHSNGTNLPPEADGANPPPKDGYTFTGPWDNPHYSWALASQVNTYWKIVGGQKQLCVTEFGYASPVDGKFAPNFGFAADVTEQQQGEYLVRAFQWMQSSGKVTGAWLFNLDYGPKGGDPAEDNNVIFSLLYRDGTPRPAFSAIGDMAKP